MTLAASSALPVSETVLSQISSVPLTSSTSRAAFFLEMSDAGTSATAPLMTTVSPYSGPKNCAMSEVAEPTCAAQAASGAVRDFTKPLTV